DAIMIFEGLFSMPIDGDLARLGAWLLKDVHTAVVLFAAVLIALWAPNLYEIFAGLHQPIGFKPRLISPMATFHPNLLWGAAMRLVLSLCILNLLMNQVSPFLYFQF